MSFVAYLRGGGALDLQNFLNHPSSMHYVLMP
jgi:hypothetical protein